MTTTLDASGLPARSLLPFLDREHTIARPGYSRWMVPPAALCVHLCIGQAYAFSVFNLPMTKLIGITKSAPDDWKLTDLGWIFSIAIFFLGRLRRCSAAGSRKADRGARCLQRRCASAAAFWLAPSGFGFINFGLSILGTACSAGPALASAIFRQYRR